jgi:hypothetical protein
MGSTSACMFRLLTAAHCGMVRRHYELWAEFNFVPRRSPLVKEDKMDKACSTHGGKEECIQDFGGKARRKETTT